MRGRSPRGLRSSSAKIKKCWLLFSRKRLLELPRTKAELADSSDEGLKGAKELVAFPSWDIDKHLRLRQGNRVWDVAIQGRSNSGLPPSSTMALSYPSLAQYVVFKLSLHLQLSIINIYSFSYTKPHAMLWNH